MAITRASWRPKVLSGGSEHIHSASPNNMLVKRVSQSRRAMLVDQYPRESPRNKGGKLSQILEGKWFPQKQDLMDGRRAGPGESIKWKILRRCLISFQT